LALYQFMLSNAMFIHGQIFKILPQF